MKFVAKIKPALQPFEMGLAIEELSSLADVPESEITDMQLGGLFYFESDVDKGMLLDNLAYWSAIKTDSSDYTKQIRLELGLGSGESPERIPRRRVLRYGVHDLHEYRGKFFPQLVASLLNISKINPSSTVLDPFCGSGTTLVEAISHGHDAAGVDLNPLSVMISSTKAALVSERLSDDLFSMLEDDLNDHSERDPANEWPSEDLHYLEKWFDPEALREIAAIRAAIGGMKGIDADFSRAVLSDQLRSVSWQKDVDLRVHKDPSKVYSPGTLTRRFLDGILSQQEKIAPYQRLQSGYRLGRTRIVQGNTLDIEALLPRCTGSFDALITSPPYATALPYLDTDRLSLVSLCSVPRSRFPELNRQMIGNREVTEKQRQELWQGYMSRRGDLPEAVTAIIDRIDGHNSTNSVGFRRRNLPALLSKYFLDMRDSMEASYNMLKNGSTSFYVVGNNSTKIGEETIVIPTDRILWEIGKSIGYEPVRTIDMELIQSRDIFKDNRGSAETILVFKKVSRWKERRYIPKKTRWISATNGISTIAWRRTACIPYILTRPG